MSGPGGDRAEHDALAERLAVRRSVDHWRKAAYGAFLSTVLAGMAAKLAYDRWWSTRATRFRGPPIFFFAAVALALGALAYVAVQARRARRLRRGEEAEFARFRELRERLGLDQ